MMRADERLANLGSFIWKAIYWLGDMTQLNDIGFLNNEAKYHWESQSKKCHYQSNSFFKKILILVD